jgi:Na+-translocating ferredoxin:NAD+ oxidoreductase RnfE subunit
LFISTFVVIKGIHLPDLEVDVIVIGRKDIFADKPGTRADVIVVNVPPSFL